MAKEYYVGKKEFFPGIGKIPFEGPKSKNPLAFKFYDAEKPVAGRKMKEHLRFSMAYWHSLCGEGSDPFGKGTLARAWNAAKDKNAAALDRADAAFEFLTKMGLEFYCFHDIDAAPDADNPAEYEKNVRTIVKALDERQKATKTKLLWSTANLFSHPRYMNGAATNPDFRVVARAAVQVKNAIDAAIALGAAGYVFWGGREGYTSLWNTDMKREREHIARFFAMARDYGRANGFKGTFLIEPKPMEPSKHQYDFDAATTIGFLREFGLDKDFKLNLEANHGTLAGHDFVHELQTAADAGLLGSIDANRGDPRNGWDTDQFPTDVYDTARVMLVVLEQGSLAPGGLNFDAKLRRNSTDLEDLFISHIGGMDSFALGLQIAAKIRKDGRIAEFKKKRYESFDSGDGKKFEAGGMDFAALAKVGMKQKKLPLESGKQELIENIVNELMF